jgi:hypothetical protein
VPHFSPAQTPRQNLVEISLVLLWVELRQRILPREGLRAEFIVAKFLILGFERVDACDSGRKVLSIRWFFEPIIFLRSQPIMLKMEPQISRKKRIRSKWGREETLSVPCAQSAVPGNFAVEYFSRYRCFLKIESILHFRPGSVHEFVSTLSKLSGRN